MNDTFFVSLTMQQAEQTAQDAAIGGSMSGERIDAYTVQSACGACRVLVFEKHYMRAENRLTLTVVLDDFEGRTRVHCAAGGGGQGLFRFDWGAAESFSQAVVEALLPYRIG